MKPKFKIKQAVLLGTLPGTVTEVAKFADHFEYLVAITGGTGSWIHEDKLTALDRDAATASKKTIN